MEVDKCSLGGSSAFLIKKQWNKEEALRLPARTLAYIGDAVYELSLRLNHVEIGIDNAGRLHDSLVDLVSSPAQAKVFEVVFADLPEEEKELVKNWRNSKIPARYGSGTRGEYAKATALEAWVGFLFITGQDERVVSIVETALKLRNQKGKDL